MTHVVPDLDIVLKKDTADVGTTRASLVHRRESAGRNRDVVIDEVRPRWTDTPTGALCALEPECRGDGARNSVFSVCRRR